MERINKAIFVNYDYVQNPKEYMDQFFKINQNQLDCQPKQKNQNTVLLYMSKNQV